MGFVIVFTVGCEHAVARARKWTKHFNVRAALAPPPPPWPRV
jgi:hypothetical protein